MISADQRQKKIVALRLSSKVDAEETERAGCVKRDRLEWRECITSGQEIFIKVILDGVGAHNEVNLGVVLGVVHDDG